LKSKGKINNEFNICYSKEVLRLDCSIKDYPMQIWCGNGENKGFTDDYEMAEKRCAELNSENKCKEIRYVIQEVEKIIKR